MAQLNITQAAKAAGIARRTLQRHIEKGKVSYETGEHGGKLIDTAELIRVYGDLKEPVTPDAVRQGGQVAHQTTPDDAPLKQRITDLEKMVDELRVDKEQYRAENKKLLTIVEQQTRLLNHKPVRRSFWEWIGLRRQAV